MFGNKSQNLELLKLEAGFREKQLFIFVLLIIIILSVTVLKNTIVDTLGLFEANRQRKDTLALVTGKASYLDSLDEASLTKQVREVEQVFPSRKPALELLNALKLLAAENKVVLGSLSLSPGVVEGDVWANTKARAEEDKGKKDKLLQQFIADFSVEGRFEDINLFIKNLPTTAPLTRIELLDLKIKSDKDVSENERVLEVSLQLAVYYQAPATKLPAVEEEVAALTSQEEKALATLSEFKFFPLVPSQPELIPGKADPFKVE